MSDPLHDSMNRLAESCAHREAPPEIEHALLAEFDRVHRRRRIVSWVTKTAALAAAIAIVVILPWRTESVAPTPDPEPVAQTEEPFIAIPYVAPLASYEHAEVVRMQLPVAALIAAGLSVSSPDPGAHVEADVLVGQDGRARALRLISVN